MNITPEDRNVFRKIIILSIISGIIGTTILVIFVIFVFTENNADDTIIFLFIGFSLESFGGYLIFTVFTT